MGIKYSSDEKFFEKWNPKMAYILGYIFADGSLENAHYLRGKYLRISSTDKELIDLIKNSLKSDHKIVIVPSPNIRSKTRYLLRIGSHKIYNDLIKLKLFPNKSLVMDFPIIESQYLSHFIRGYFDGDGHVSVEKKGDSLKKLKVVFTSGSLSFLKSLSKRLDKILDLKIKKVYQSHRSFQLSYSTSDSVKIFRYIYQDNKQMFLKRKYDIFKKFFIDYNKWADDTVLKIIKYSGHVVK